MAIRDGVLPGAVSDGCAGRERQSATGFHPLVDMTPGRCRLPAGHVVNRSLVAATGNCGALPQPEGIDPLQTMRRCP